LLALLRELSMPIFTTLHTILREPNTEQRRVTGSELIIPYAMSDSVTSFATVSIDEVLTVME
jgi:hypothetical protein